MLLVLFFAIYLPVIRGEEMFLRQRFPEFEAYARQVPRMFPRIIPLSGGEEAGEFCFTLYLKHREYNALLGALAMVAALVVKKLAFR